MRSCSACGSAALPDETYCAACSEPLGAGALATTRLAPDRVVPATALASVLLFVAAFAATALVVGLVRGPREVAPVSVPVLDAGVGAAVPLAPAVPETAPNASAASPRTAARPADPPAPRADDPPGRARADRDPDPHDDAADDDDADEDTDEEQPSLGAMPTDSPDYGERAAAVIHENQGEAVGCYEAAFPPRFARPGGTVELRFLVGSAGRASLVNVVRDDLGSAALARCLTDAVTRWSFPPAGGGDVAISYPFSFSTR